MDVGDSHLGTRPLGHTLGTPSPTFPCQNFFPGATSVTIGGQPCSDLVVANSSSLGVLTCRAPPGPGYGAIRLEVTVAGQSGSAPFVYNAPTVTWVGPSPSDAEANSPIEVCACWHGCVLAGVRVIVCCSLSPTKCCAHCAMRV